MSEFFHHPDGWIALDDLQLPLQFWLTQEPEYSLPIGAVARQYIQGDRHSVFTPDQRGGEFPWSKGDEYLSKIEQYRTAWEAYQNIPSAPDTRPDYRAIVTALSPGGSIAGLFLKAAKSKAPPLIQGTLPAAMANGNLPAIKACLEAIVGSMAEGDRFTEAEIVQLQSAFEECRIPLSISTKLDPAKNIEGITIAINSMP